MNVLSLDKDPGQSSHSPWSTSLGPLDEHSQFRGASVIIITLPLRKSKQGEMKWPVHSTKVVITEPDLELSFSEHKSIIP
jgi:hypothetical protein